MEIVKNGELLEGQIMEDARAKAGRLRDAADKECAAIAAEGEQHLRDEVRKLQEAHQAQVATMRSELEAALPLEFRRARLAFLQEALDRALADWFAGLSDAAVGRIIRAQVARGADALAGRTVNILAAGLKPDQARAVVAAALPGVTISSVAELPAGEAAVAVRGVVVESADRGRRLRATLGELKEQLMDGHREELITALFGKDAIR